MKKDKNTITKEKTEQLSDKRITELIPRHKNSELIREDILNYGWGKRGITFNLIYVLIMAVVGVIVLGVVGFLFSNIYSGLNQDVVLGQVNLSNVTEQTYGVFYNAYNTNLDLFGLFLIFGMIGGLFFASYLMRGTWDKLLIIVDIFIMVVVYILAVALSNYYETLLVASSGIINVFEESMPRTSNFLLHLPRYVVIIGAISMILFYSAIPKREGETSPVAYEGEQNSIY